MTPDTVHRSPRYRPRPRSLSAAVCGSAATIRPAALRPFISWMGR